MAENQLDPDKSIQKATTIDLITAGLSGQGLNYRLAEMERIEQLQTEVLNMPEGADRNAKLVALENMKAGLENEL